MRTTLYRVDFAEPVRLAVMPRPRGGKWLAEDMAALRADGVDTLVSALTTQDRFDLDLDAEPALAVKAGMSYVSFPIEDFSVPEPAALADLASSLGDELRAGRFVVVHCRGGVGRSGLIACAALIDLGSSADEAMDVVSRARGHAAPETEEQRRMLQDLGA